MISPWEHLAFRGFFVLELMEVGVKVKVQIFTIPPINAGDLSYDSRPVASRNSPSFRGFSPERGAK